MTPRRRRRLHWMVPVAVIAAATGISVLPQVLPAGADPVPVLPTLTPAQLLDKVRTSNVMTLSGDIRFSTRLGLPDLSALGVRSGTFLDLLTGMHVAHVWVDGPEHARLAIDSPQAESDWIRNGTDLWSWDSSSQAVTHATLPAESAHDTARKALPVELPAVDPASAAQQLLDALDPTTVVTVQTPGYVAGRPVYELVLAPRSAASTVADGEIAVDSATGVPLAVRVHAKDATTPAFEIAFTSISFDQPAASTFTFTPPPGAVVSEADQPSQLLPLGSFGRHGNRRVQVAAPDGAPAPAPRAPRAPLGAAATDARSQVTVIGTGWESVAIITGVPLGGQFQALFANAPSVTVGSASAKLVSTTLLNVLVLDDGRVAVGALTPEALEAAVAAA